MKRIRVSLRAAAVGTITAGALLLIAGCGSTSQHGGARGTKAMDRVTTTGTNSALLRDWAGFPVNAVPRPFVLTGNPIIDPASGFSSNDDKVAYISGSLDVLTQLPSVTAAADGQRVASAQAALALLRSQGAGAKPGSTHLQITSVTLGVAVFDTDRGKARLPAWRFRLRGVADPVFVLALPQAGWWPRPGMPQGQVVSQENAVAGGRHVTISFVGAPAGSGPCDAEYTADVAESSTAVVVTPRALPHAHPAENYACNAIGVERSVTVTLSRPLGARVLLTLGGAPLPAR